MAANGHNLKYKEFFNPGSYRLNSSELSSNFIKTFLNGLNKVCTRQTQDDLGDRSAYIGASDVNANCIRRIVLEKREAATPKRIDLQQGIYFQRGHLAETILREALIEENIPHYYQPELIHPTEPWLVAHLDFMFVGSDSVLVNDMKTGHIPSGPDFWERQLHIQMGLAKLNFPGKSVLGGITVIDLTAGEVKQFNGFSYDPHEFARAFKRARFIKHVMKNGGEDRYTAQTPLCSWCRYIAGCPEYMTGNMVEITDRSAIELFRNYHLASTTQTQVKKSYEKLRGKLLKVVLGYGEISDKVKIDGYILKAKSFRRTTVDGKRLKSEKPGVHKEYVKTTTSYKLNCIQAVDEVEAA